MLMSAQKKLINVLRTVTTQLAHMYAVVMRALLLMLMD